jgi:hypothetical protein
MFLLLFQICAKKCTIFEMPDKKPSGFHLVNIKNTNIFDILDKE